MDNIKEGRNLGYIEELIQVSSRDRMLLHVSVILLKTKGAMAMIPLPTSGDLLEEHVTFFSDPPIQMYKNQVFLNTQRIIKAS